MGHAQATSLNIAANRQLCWIAQSQHVDLTLAKHEALQRESCRQPSRLLFCKRPHCIEYRVLGNPNTPSLQDHPTQSQWLDAYSVVRTRTLEAKLGCPSAAFKGYTRQSDHCLQRWPEHSSQKPTKFRASPQRHGCPSSTKPEHSPRLAIAIRSALATRWTQ